MLILIKCKIWDSLPFIWLLGKLVLAHLTKIMIIIIVLAFNIGKSSAVTSLTPESVTNSNHILLGLLLQSLSNRCF